VSAPARLLAGVDGCPAGWLRLARDPATSAIAADVLTTDALLADAGRFAAIAIDVPIGLSDDGPRACDVEARRRLGPRRSSVFPAPVRAALDARDDDYGDACARSAAACGKRLSRQTHAILWRIREVDAALRASPALSGRVHEAHPELCFGEWNGGAPMAHPKRTAEGLAERRRLVDATFGGDAFARVRERFRPSQVADDDVLDAFAALWTAGRIAAGESYTVPASPPRDTRGLPMRMAV
jgi:predicted RNase H-like nuclease